MNEIALILFVVNWVILLAVCLWDMNSDHLVSTEYKFAWLIAMITTPLSFILYFILRKKLSKKI